MTPTGIDENDIVRVFDPYYLDQPLDTDGVQMVYDHPCEYNRLVPRPCFERETHEVYALGEIDTREAILLFNDRTRLNGREYHRIHDLTQNGGNDLYRSAVCYLCCSSQYFSV